MLISVIINKLSYSVYKIYHKGLTFSNYGNKYIIFVVWQGVCITYCYRPLKIFKFQNFSSIYAIYKPTIACLGLRNDSNSYMFMI